MDWQARLAEQRESFQKAPGSILTKPTKPGSVSSVSKQDRHFQKIASCDDTELLERCRTACRGLSLWPAELMAAMTDDDKAAQLSGEEGPEALRAFAESLAARLRTGKLPENLHEAYARLRAELAANPSLRFTSEVLTPDADPILLAVAVRGAGFATLRIAKDRYDEGQLLEIIDRVGRPSPCVA